MLFSKNGVENPSVAREVNTDFNIIDYRCISSLNTCTVHPRKSQQHIWTEWLVGKNKWACRVNGNSFSPLQGRRVHPKKRGEGWVKDMLFSSSVTYSVLISVKRYLWPKIGNPWAPCPMLTTLCMTLVCSPEANICAVMNQFTYNQALHSWRCMHLTVKTITVLNSDTISCNYNILPISDHLIQFLISIKLFWLICAW